MHTRLRTSPGPSTFGTNTFKVNSSPAPNYDVLAPDSHGFASAIGAASVRRRVGNGNVGGAFDDPWREEGEPEASSASASSTGLDSRSTHANGQSHPLQANGSEYTADTRPRLGRMLSSRGGKGAVWGFSDGWVEDEPEESREAARPNGLLREMLVHKVQPKDSLAGVALRYGVSIADIRRANKLWAADSIHLRSVLYIPLTPNLKLGYSSNLIDLNQECDVPPSSDHTSSSVDDASKSDSDAPTIQHVPVSELSFFPPPATPKRKPAAGTTRSASSPFASDPPFLFSPRVSSTSPFFSNSSPQQLSSSPSRGTGTLSSLFSALPIPDAVQRLSIDSIAGGALTPRPSSSASDASERPVELFTMTPRSVSTKPKRTIRTQPTHGPVMTVPRRSIEGGNQGTTAGFGLGLGVVDDDW